MKDQGVGEDRLLLLKGVSGAFRPGVLTALMGVSGTGKTTLMDVLAGIQKNKKHSHVFLDIMNKRISIHLMLLFTSLCYTQPGSG